MILPVKYNLSVLGFHPLEFESVSQMHMLSSDETHLHVNVSFDKSTVFHHFSDVLVIASAKFEQGPKRQSVAAVWVKDVTHSGFTGVIRVPEPFTNNQNSSVHLEYVAYQMNVHRRTNMFEGGSIDIPKWETSSRCMHIKPKVCSNCLKILLYIWLYDLARFFILFYTNLHYYCLRVKYKYPDMKGLGRYGGRAIITPIYGMRNNSAHETRIL